MNALDRVIGYFAPRAALQRARARAATRVYEGASVGRRSSSWRTLHTSANAEIQLAIRPLRDRARDLARNTPHAPRMLDILVSHTIGTGLVPVPATGSDRLDRQVIGLWNDWVERSDVTGQLSFYAMQALAVRSMIESGEVVTRFIDMELDDNLPVPMQMQLLESDYIDQFRDGIYGDPKQTNSNRLIRSRLGVGLGHFDRRIGLWLWPYHPGEITTLNMRPLVSTFVDGGELAHMFKVLRPGQVRGVPWFSPILTAARDLSDFIDAANVKARVEACFAAFITNSDDSTVPLMDSSIEGINQTFDPANPTVPVTTLEPGMMKELRSGQDIKFAQPTAATQIEPILMFNLQAMAAAVGCTYDQVTGDLRQANYSSLRAGKLDFWRLVSQLQQHTVIPMLCRPTWERFISRAVLAGRLRSRTGGYPCEWVVPAREAVDPKKDLDAEIHEVRAGRVSPQRFIASKGGNWRTTLPDFASFFELADELGVTLDIDPRRTDQHGRAPIPSAQLNASQATIEDASFANADDAADEESSTDD
jgi:lambda family phage portal protein